MFDFRRAFGVFVAIGMLASCGGSQPAVRSSSALDAPYAISGALPQGVTANGGRGHRAAGSGDLLYVTTDVNVFFAVNYKTGKRQQVSYMNYGAGGGDCTDSGGNVFIAASEGSPSVGGFIFKFAHGGTAPLATLSDGSYYPTGCAVDPTTGNLAVSNDATPNCNGGGDLAVYPDAQGSPISYTDPGFQCFLGATYDNDGDLFIGGMGYGSGHLFVLAELPNGGSALTDITLGQPIACQILEGTCKNSLQWDGQYVAVTQHNSKASPSVSQVLVYGSNGTVVRTIKFKGRFGSKAGGDVSFIDGGNIILGRQPGSLSAWNYPAGGKLQRTIVKGLTHFQYTGLTLSPGR